MAGRDGVDRVDCRHPRDDGGRQVNAGAQSNARTIVAVLMKARRRIVAANFWRDASVGLSLALVIGEAAILWGTRLGSIKTRWTFAVAALIAAVVAAAIRALFTRPALREVAGLLDGRLRLAEHLVTAMQFLGHDDAFAQLVEREAAARLAGFQLATAVPVNAPRAALA